MPESREQPRADDLTASPPPARGLPLAWRVAIATATVTILVMGAGTAFQQYRETDRERAARETLLRESLSPLLADLAQAPDRPAIQERLRAYEQAYVRQGYGDHRVLLHDSGGHVFASSVKAATTKPPDGALQATVSVASSALPGLEGTLTVWQDSGEFEAEQRLRWRFWWTTIGVTALCIVLSLQVALTLLVVHPIRRLLDGLRRMQMGYAGPLVPTTGAWEIRTLAWQFTSVTERLQESVRRLVEAERRGLRDLFGRDGAAAGVAEPERAEEAAPSAALPQAFLEQYLRDRCRLLKALDPASPEAHEAAREAWEQHAADAERLGQMELKANLEDTALRILEPAEFAACDSALDALRMRWGRWAAHREATLRKALEAHGVAYVSVGRRVKHTAGVWRKMRAKGIELEQVHDVFAFRVVVPEEADCYAALGVVHGLFEPSVLRFKDYVAEPKANGYQSLHTSVRDAEGPVFEVQIRSRAMHARAERGLASHWVYKGEQTREVGTPGRIARWASAWRRTG